MCGRTQSATVKVTVACLSQCYAGWTGPLYLPVHARPGGGGGALFPPPHARGGAAVGVVRRSLTEQRDHIEVPAAALVEQHARHARDDAFLEEGHGVLSEEIHRLVRRAGPVDLRLAGLLRRRLVPD